MTFYTLDGVVLQYLQHFHYNLMEQCTYNVKMYKIYE